MNFDNAVLQVPIEDIIPNRFQPRLAFDDASLQELSNSIKEHGVIQPIVLRKVGEKYEIIAGERRYKASKMAGLVTIPAVISDIDDQKSAEVAVVENIQRKNLTAIEEAKSYKALLDQGFISQEELAKRMGLSQSAISNKLRLLSLAPEIQDAVMQGKISERHARSLLVIKDNETQLKWLSRIIEERLNVRQLDNELKKSFSINDSENIEYIKNNASDIEIKNENSNIDSPSTISDLGPIDLGATNKNKFYNELENEAVNMSTTDFSTTSSNELNFDSNSVLSSNSDTNNSIPDDIETLEIDSLDFIPPVKSLPDNIIDNDLNMIVSAHPEYKININKEASSDKIVYTIEIKEN